jgi:hypothetical protein
MKEVIMIYAVLLTLATAIEGLPILGGNRKVAEVELIKKAKEQKSSEPTKKLSKHNLNRGQLKQMYYLQYLDKA